MIQQFANFFAQIGGMSQARELVGLQRSARGGEQEFPRRLGVELRRHSNLQNIQPGYVFNINAVVITGDSNAVVNLLWKPVENRHVAFSLCSGCSGNYEDPDWTAWDQDPPENEELSDVSGEADEQEPREPK